MNNHNRFKFNFRNIKNLLFETYNQWLDDKCLKMAAALSYYTMFSLSPLIIIVIAIAGFVFGREAARGEIVAQLSDLIGKDGAVVIETMIKGSSSPEAGIIATIISVVVLILGSIGSFLELKESLNIIWGVELKPGQGIGGYFKQRLDSFTMVMGSGFLLIVSLVISAGLSGLNKYLSTQFDWLLPVLQAVNFLVSFIVISILFAMIYKYLPDVIIGWRYVWIGAFATSFFFSVGKFLIGLYLGNNSYSSTFGTAGSIAVLLVWLYYSSMIFFFGAEFTQVYRNTYAPIPLVPSRDAVVIPKVSYLVKESIKKKDAA